MTTINLTHAIGTDGKTLNSLSLRRLKMGDLRAARRAENEIDMISIVAARLAGVSIDAIDELDAADANDLYAAVAEKVAAFKH